MIGSGLKKFARENGMQVGHGVAYGSLQGYTATLSEGAGYKQIIFSTKFSSQEQKDQILAAANAVNLSRTYRVQSLEIGVQTVQVVFNDNPGTMKKLREFVDWFTALLGQYGASRSQVCTECGMGITAGKWVLINDVAYYLHDACAQKAAREIQGENEQRREADTGSYLIGTFGAVLGAALGAIVWALVLNLGYVASIVGFLIGWLAEKGYNLFKGKQGKAKVLILVLAVIIGVLLGCFLADAFTLAGMINSGELGELTYGDIPYMILLLLAEDADYAGAVVSNILTGLLFAGLGVFSLLRKAGKETEGTKYIEL